MTRLSPQTLQKRAKLNFILPASAFAATPAVNKVFPE